MTYAPRLATMTWFPDCQQSAHSNDEQASHQTYRHADRIRQRHPADDDRADLPRQMHRRALVSLWPEQVEEEGGAEDGGDGDADEDVVGGDADNVIIVNGGVAVEGFDEALLVHVVCERRKLWIRDGVEGKRDGGDPYLITQLFQLIQSTRRGSWRTGR